MRMPVQVILDLPKDLFSIPRSSPDVFVKELRLAAAAKWYEVGRISHSKAAELAGISRREFLDALARFEVSPFQATPVELADELDRG
jgi:predicted HTH domain antitoxin